MTRDRSVYAGSHYTLRFCIAKRRNAFSNTVLSLSTLQKYDSKPFIVCLITPEQNYLLLANTTFLRKISHSSQALRIDNIKGSFNGSDILRSYEGIENEPKNFSFLFASHQNFTFAENLERLVEATNHICPTGQRFAPTDLQLDCIRRSVQRADSFLSSEEYTILNNDLQNRVNAVASEIAIAALIDNVNLRGRVIEYLITEPESLRKTLVDALHSGRQLPDIFTADKLGDYERLFASYHTATNIKTKIMFLSSNPKGYNIDKLLAFLAEENSVYLIFIVAIDENRHISTRLCSMYSSQLLGTTRILKHWAGRNSRGVTQYDGQALERIVAHFDRTIEPEAAQAFLSRCLNA